MADEEMIGYMLVGVGILSAVLGGTALWQKHRADAAEAQVDAVESQLETCSSANADLTTKFDGLQADANRFRDAAARAQARSAKALKDAQAREEQERSEREAMEALLSHPPSTEAVAVVAERAVTILRGVVVSEQRGAAEPPPPAVKRGEINPALVALNLQ